jgi:hypothetical protein
MKAMFGVVSLLVVLAIVGIVATRQLKAVGHIAGAAPSTDAGASAPLPQISGSVPVSSQARQIETQVANDIAKAMQQGAARQADVDK